MRNSSGLVLAVALGACSVALDFDDLEDLPCPCAPGFVCIKPSDRCVPAGSSEPFKACSPETPLTGDELCPENHRCVALNGMGHRCLPSCVPVNYARPTAGANVAAQCPFDTTCWNTDKGGVCSEGVCRDNPNSCTEPGQRCGVFNGAGVCFTECQILGNICGADETCHPIGVSDITACVQTGNLPAGSVCTRPQDGMCEKFDGTRPLICAGFEASSDEQLFCRPVCDPVSGTGCIGGETCFLVRARIDPTTGSSVGACE